MCSSFVYFFFQGTICLKTNNCRIYLPLEILGQDIPFSLYHFRQQADTESHSELLRTSDLAHLLSDLADVSEK